MEWHTVEIYSSIPILRLDAYSINIVENLSHVLWHYAVRGYMNSWHSSWTYFLMSLHQIVYASGFTGIEFHNASTQSMW